jgi:hypothetical protein
VAENFFEIMDSTKSMGQRIIQAIKDFLSLKYGVEFFSYNDKNNNFLKTDIGKVPKNASFFDKAKLFMTAVIINYIKVLGTEKS